MKLGVSKPKFLKNGVKGSNSTEVKLVSASKLMQIVHCLAIQWKLMHVDHDQSPAVLFTPGLH